MNRSAFKQGFYEVMDSRFTTAALIAVNGINLGGALSQHSTGAAWFNGVMLAVFLLFAWRERK